ncbi:MAG: HAMP domain-containing histidine kinase [Bacteroidales bacterium]|nr:HAMP domain-containing histidine kinase [Clostridium sp.]MCM1204879.1 HAMP domain-containing histidine kinase [Bacteroidales bacterium]
MFSIGRTFRSKLIWYLVGCVLISGLIAVGCAYLVIYFGQDLIDQIYNDEEVNRTFQVKYIEDLQGYVDTNKITVETVSDLRYWTEENAYVYISVYWKNTVLFNSDYYYAGTIDATELEEADLQDSEYLYQLALADGTMTKVDIFCYDYWKYYTYIWIVGVVLGVILFICILTRLLNKKFQFINQMLAELQILEGGNLEYPITVKGEDELGNLARGIEQMRLSIIDNMQKEQRMLQANKDLVTAMSHDLRTPLTTLTGYLEILNMGHVADEEQRKHYLELSLAKSQEIRELSDELFEYFLIYGENQRRIEVEPVPVYMLVLDLLENQFLSLEEEGYELVRVNNTDEHTGNCLVNGQYMQRVLNNILSNLGKYADKEKPIEVSAAREQDYLVISVRNGVQKNRDTHESTKIGLITCERIMKLHRGEFQKYEVEGEFTVKLTIPMEKQ